MLRNTQCVSLAFALMLAAVVLAPGAALGQTTQNVSPQPHARTVYRRRPSLDEQVKNFAKALDLDDAQRASLKTILEQRQMQARRIQFDSSIAGADRISRFRALQQDTVLRIRALLNEEQKKKYDPLNHGTQTSSPQPSIEDWLKSAQRETH